MVFELDPGSEPFPAIPSSGQSRIFESANCNGEGINVYSSPLAHDREIAFGSSAVLGVLG